jgi:hypothetical protein
MVNDKSSARQYNDLKTLTFFHVFYGLITISKFAKSYEILKICQTAHLTINYFDKKFMLEINNPIPDKHIH